MPSAVSVPLRNGWQFRLVALAGEGLLGVGKRRLVAGLLLAAKRVAEELAGHTVAHLLGGAQQLAELERVLEGLLLPIQLDGSRGVDRLAAVHRLEGADA